MDTKKAREKESRKHRVETKMRARSRGRGGAGGDTMPDVLAVPSPATLSFFNPDALKARAKESRRYRVDTRTRGAADKKAPTETRGRICSPYLAPQPFFCQVQPRNPDEGGEKQVEVTPCGHQNGAGKRTEGGTVRTPKARARSRGRGGAGGETMPDAAVRGDGRPKEAPGPAARGDPRR